MGAAFGLVQLANFENVKEKEFMLMKEWSQYLRNLVNIRTGIPFPEAEIVWMHFPL